MSRTVFHTPDRPPGVLPRHSRLYSPIALIASLLVAGCADPSRPREPAEQEIATSAQIAGEASPTRISINGPYADLYETYFNGSVYLQIQASVWTTTTRDQAYLSYEIAECDPVTFDCQWVEAGTGPIPGGDLVGRPGHLELSTNTSATANPEFDLQQGSGGPIQIRWTELSGWSSSSNYHSRYRFEGFITQSHGTQTSSGALAEGRLLAIELTPSAGYASMGTIRYGDIAVSREQ